MNSLRRIGCHFLLLAFSCVFQLAPAYAQAAGPAAIVQDDAWWTGPMLANSAETLPQGHVLIEPYLYNIMAEHSNSYGSRTYMNYGLVDRLTVGIIPIFGYNQVDHGPNSSGVLVGDFTVQAQYRLTKFHEGSWIPTIAIQLQQSFPTGKYDQLGNRPSNGIGSGAYATDLGINAQTYFRLPNRRLLRLRLNVSETFSSHVDVNGVSVYGTGPNFRGTVEPGNSTFVDTSVEYSLTQRWVLALDAIYSRSRNNTMNGVDFLSTSSGLPNPSRVYANAGASESFGYAPAVEYSWTSNLGVLLGVRVIAGGHNTERTVTPAIAINYVN
jgi:hypothetical protein